MKTLIQDIRESCYSMEELRRLSQGILDLAVALGLASQGKPEGGQVERTMTEDEDDISIFTTELQYRVLMRGIRRQKLMYKAALYRCLAQLNTSDGWGWSVPPRPKRRAVPREKWERCLPEYVRIIA